MHPVPLTQLAVHPRLVKVVAQPRRPRLEHIAGSSTRKLCVGQVEVVVVVVVVMVAGTRETREQSSAVNGGVNGEATSAGIQHTRRRDCCAAA
jgi:hypothetical protein